MSPGGSREQGRPDCRFLLAPPPDFGTCSSAGCGAIFRLSDCRVYLSLAQKAVWRIDPIFTPRRLNPDDAKIIFHPIDYVVFNGMKGGERMRSVILLDREGATADQRRLQKSIEKTVERGRLAWQTLRVGDDGTITSEQ
jgi:hypothetical protein